MAFFNRQRVTTLALAFAGASIFALLGLPLPFLLGPMCICLIGALAGANMQSLGVVETIFRTILGVAAGASFTPEITSQIPSMAASLSILPIFVGIVAASSFPLMRKVFGFDTVTSYYSAMPGGLQDLMVFGEEAGANLRALALIQATRVLFVVSIMPIILTTFWSVDLTTRPGVPSSETPLTQFALFAFCGIGGWQIAKRLKIFGASIIGPLILTAAMSIGGVISQRPPAEMIWAAQFFIGMTVGAKYTGVTLNELRNYVFAGVLNGIVLSAVSAVFIVAVITLGLASSLNALLAFLPGGQGEMVVLALIAGADLSYVVLHHMFRIFLVVTCTPLLIQFFDREKT